MIYKFKNGSKIHIKENQKGSFTKYCNGKVTNECIQRGKNSPDPKIRKKAVFAQNSRRWKHKDGGFVNGVNVLDSNPKACKHLKNKLKVKKAQTGSKLSNTISQVGNFLKSDTGKSVINAGQSILGGIQQANSINKIKSSFNDYNKQYRKQMEAQAMNNPNINLQVENDIQNADPTNPNAMRGSIVRNNLMQKYRKQALNNASSYIDSNLQNLQAKQNAYISSLENQSNESIKNGILGLSNLAGNLNFSSNKVQSPTRSQIDTTFKPLANQTMNQIRNYQI